MDILNDIINAKGAELISSLTAQGFGADKAKDFLSEAGSNIMSSIGSGKVDLDTGDTMQKASSIIGNIDVAALAAKVGIDSTLASKGLDTIVPTILNLLQDKLGDSQGILGMLSKAKSSGIGDMFKKLF